MQGAQPLGVIMTAPRRFAVHGKDRLVSAAGRGRLGAQGLQPVAEASLKRGRVEKHQHAAKDILAGNAGRQGQHLPEKVLLGAGPAGNRGGAAGTGEHGHQRNDHHAHQGMLAIDGRTRILQRVEMSDDLVHRHAGKLGHDPSSVGCSTACHTENDLQTTASRRKPPYLARITQKYALALYLGTPGNVSDTVTVGNNGDLSGVLGSVVVTGINNPGAVATLNVDDSRDLHVVGRTVTVYNPPPILPGVPFPYYDASFSGLGNVYYTPGNLQALNVSGGMFGNTFNVLGTGGSFTTTLNTGL